MPSPLPPVAQGNVCLCPALSVQCLIRGSQLCSQMKSWSCSSRREGEGTQQQPQGLYSYHDPVQTLAPHTRSLGVHSNGCHGTSLPLRPRQRWAACLAVNLLFPPPSPLAILLWLLALTLLASVKIQAFPSLKNLLGHCYVMLLSNR